MKRLHEAVENGIANAADSSLKDRLAEFVAIRDQTRADAARVEAAIEHLGPAVTTETLRTFSKAARRKLRNEDGAHRRDHLRMVGRRVEVVNPQAIRIAGSKTELSRTLSLLLA